MNLIETANGEMIPDSSITGARYGKHNGDKGVILATTDGEKFCYEEQFLGNYDYSPLHEEVEILECPLDKPSDFEFRGLFRPRTRETVWSTSRGSFEAPPPQCGPTAPTSSTG